MWGEGGNAEPDGGRYLEGLDPPEGLPERNHTRYKAHIETKKAEFYNEDTKEYTGIDSAEWIARRRTHMKERRYKEYKRFFQLTQLLFAATIASFSESYFEVHVPAVEGGDGAALWRRMKSHDMDEDSVVSFDIFSRLFAIQQGARSLIDYFSEFMTLRRSFIRMTSHDEDLKIPPKIWILLFCDRLSSEFKELLVNLKSMGTDIYSKSLDTLYQIFSTYARDKDIPNEIGKKSSGGTALSAGPRTFTAKQLKNYNKKIKGKARTAFKKQIRQRLSNDPSALAALGHNGRNNQSNNRKTNTCINCDKVHDEPPWKCPIGHCTATLSNGQKCGSTKHRAMWKRGEGKICGIDNYDGPKRKSTKSVTFAGAASTATTSASSVEVNAMMAHLGFGMTCDMHDFNHGNGDSLFYQCIPCSEQTPSTDFPQPLLLIFLRLLCWTTTRLMTTALYGEKSLMIALIATLLMNSY